MVILEALNALYGDCLILRYDHRGQERRWLIDGGPRAETVGGQAVAVWKDVLLPRLDQIDKIQPFVFELGMVSHIDDDHINGLMALTSDLLATDPPARVVEFSKFWFNTFDEVVGPAPASLAAVHAEAAVQLGADTVGRVPSIKLEEDGAAVAQSVPQGNKLAGNLRALGLEGNPPFNNVISVQKDQPAQTVGGASVTIIGPLQKRLDKLRAKWMKALQKKTTSAKTAALQELFSTKLDSSVPNLSSIVMLVEVGGRSLLLTGDARGDDIVKAWQELGLPEAKRTVDLLKMPHHGSKVNSPKSFIQFFPATHYVFSADGHYDNPDPPLLEGLVSIHSKRQIVLHFTNAEIIWSKPYVLEKGGAKVKSLAEMLPALKAAYPGPWSANIRPSGKLSVEINL